MKAILCSHGIKPKGKCRLCRLERKRLHRIRRRDHIKEHKKEYYQMNKEKVDLKNEEWRECNPEKSKELRKYASKKWYEKHKGNPYLKQQKRIENMALEYPLGLTCELCPDEDIEINNLQRHHPSYEENMDWFFVTCCKSCHWYADRSTIVEGQINIKRVD
jgi:hypothetical protein